MHQAQKALFLIAVFLLMPGVPDQISVAHAAQAIEISDDRGVIVRLPAPPRRVVSLLPSLTEAVCALGQCDRLVGVDRYSNYPTQLRALPQLGGGLDPSVESIVALKPDLVLIAQSSRVVEKLQSLGLPVAVLEPKTHADVRRVLGQLSTLLGAGDASALWDSLQREVEQAAQSVPAAARGQRVYFEVDATPYAASESSFIGETLARLQVRNIVPGQWGPFPKLNPEFVVRADPQVIFVGQASRATLLQRPGWTAIAAVRQGRLCSFSREESDMLVRPGPRLAQAARLMARCLGGTP